MSKVLIACEESQAVTKETRAFPKRAIIRSRAFIGVAKAMAEQWGLLVK